jgi:hypothetical protein
LVISDGLAQLAAHGVELTLHGGGFSQAGFDYDFAGFLARYQLSDNRLLAGKR